MVVVMVLTWRQSSSFVARVLCHPRRPVDLWLDSKLPRPHPLDCTHHRDWGIRDWDDLGVYADRNIPG